MAALPMSRPSCACGPFQSPHPPVLAGSHGAAGLRRVVEYGDEWRCANSGGWPSLPAAFLEPLVCVPASSRLSWQRLERDRHGVTFPQPARTNG